MKKMIAALAAVIAIGAGAWFFVSGTLQQTATSASPQGAGMASITLPDRLSSEAEMGKKSFDAACAGCHGTHAAGSEGFGPPLVHKIYEPSHHGDMAFFMAVQQGARAHHWPFGDMPAIDGVNQTDIGHIVAYVRELQRANGIN